MRMTSHSEKKYYVVEFPDDNPITVDVVPGNWLINKHECWWPARCDSDKLKAIRKDYLPPQGSWGRHKCRELGVYGKSTS